MRAAIIGAGSSGIAAAKALHDAGIDFDCFEKSDRIGGNWVFGNKNGMSSAYEGLYINTSRDRMQYADYPMPRTYPDFPHHTQIARYFEDYVDHFGFRKHIAFETGVEHAAREGNRWKLQLSATRRRTTRSSSRTATTGIRSGPILRSPARASPPASRSPSLR